MVTIVLTSFVLAIAISARVVSLNDETEVVIETTDLPEPMRESKIFYISQSEYQEARTNRKNISAIAAAPARLKNRRKNSTLNEAIQMASRQGLNAMIDLYERKEPEILRKGQSVKQHLSSIANSLNFVSGEFLDFNHPATLLSLFSAPMTNESDAEVKGAYASLFAAKKLQER